MPEQSNFRFKRRTIVIVIAIIIALAAWGIISRMVSASNLKDDTHNDSILTVKVTKPQKSAPDEEIVFPGNVQAWHEAPIYARTSGYLKSWVIDIGTNVKQGQLLATIEAPEVDSQLRQAKADLETAQANNKLAQSTAKRWADLLKTDSVSKQEADEKESDALAKAALVASAKANSDRLTDLQSFKRVVAPFDGVITARNTDTGALINAGSSSVGPELFHIADISRLRVYVQVPQNYAAAITPGMKAELHFAEHAGKIFTATLNKSANALDPTSRTLLAQFETDNKDNVLLAGGYAEVHMKLGTFAGSLRLPSNTLLFRSNDVEVATVVKDKDDTGHVTLKIVTLGRDFGNDVEIATGISEGDLVILNPPDSVITGQQVKIFKGEPEKAKAGSEEKPKVDKKP